MRVRDHKKKKKKSARWHVYTSHFMPACVFAHVRRRIIAAISDYLGSLVGSLVATATPALLTLNKRTERLGERASLWVLLGRCRSGWECGCNGRL